MKPAGAYAHTNIALVKYWGKRDARKNLPATGSLSLTLDRFGTRTELHPLGQAEGPDEVVLDGERVEGRPAQRVSTFLDLVRGQADSRERCRVTSRNDVPTAAGLASSASAFAALAVAADAAFELGLESSALSALARQGSGSAARSLFGGFALMHRGERDDGADSFAEPCPAAASLDVRLLVARCAVGPKKVPSTEGMDLTARTSPFYPVWVETHAADLDVARRALEDGDLEQLGEVMEHSTLKMHASALGARPGLWYLAPATVAAMTRVRELRAEGTPAWFTMDAGPHVKVLCAADQAERVAAALRDVEGVHDVTVAGPGPDARVQPHDELEAGLPAGAKGGAR